VYVFTHKHKNWTHNLSQIILKHSSLVIIISETGKARAEATK